jgi:hypothetical protein
LNKKSIYFDLDREKKYREYLKKESADSKVYIYWNEFITKSKLPSYEWVKNHIFIEGAIKDGRPDRHHQSDKITAPCRVLDIYQFYSEEFIEYLAKTINDLNAQKIVEIGAGAGFLSYFLKEKGIDIIPTDDYSRPYIKYTDQVKKLKHREALEKYNPDLVVINW